MDYDDLKREFPRLIPADFVFECGPGWIGSIHGFFVTVDRWLPTYTRMITWARLNDLELDGTRPLGHWWTLKQIKEKFGGLRIYYSVGGAVVDEAIEAISAALELAEARAMHTCEICGEPGMLRRGGYMQTLCGEHATEPPKQKPRPRIEGTYLRKGGDGSWYKYDPLLDRMVRCDPPGGYDDD